ncbi:MAG: acyltransferase [Caulobacterales bacterium 68-7]|nr:1-acyl-sn-glycerol-3-phosphate acyltransferase [Caulobacterales bacterium]OJU08604.1 MAG: acyltransferase [Caulobacterales bacterium 68-7]
MHIVDELIAERAPGLSGSPAWPLVRPALYALLGYGKARAMADAVAPMDGRAAFDHVSRLLDLKIEATGLERIPREGPVILVCNHPTGIADGFALFDAVRPIRPDVIFYANADALRVAPRLGDSIIPVEWVEAKRTREKMKLTLAGTRAALEGGRCLAIFPSGRLARVERGVLTEEPWAGTPLSLARKYDAPVVPIHMTGPSSMLFHLFDKVSHELRDITLFHEMLNKHGGRFTLTVGPAIAPDDLPDDIAPLQAYVEHTLPQHPDQPFA